MPNNVSKRMNFAPRPSPARIIEFDREVRRPWLAEGVARLEMREPGGDIERRCSCGDRRADRSPLIDGLAFEIEAAGGRVADEAQAGGIERPVARREPRRVPFSEMIKGDFD